MTIRLGAVNHRWQLADLLNSRGLLGEAVEVGTHRGDFARDFRYVWKGRVLHCIDPWACPPGYEEQAKTLDGGGADREKDFARFKQKLKLAIDCGSVSVLRECSPAAAEKFADSSLDFVFLDGDHSLLGVSMDLSAWWLKLRKGGILAGHDWLCPGEVQGGWGQFVQEAVASFSTMEAVDVFLVPEFGGETSGQPWSFYMEKP